MTIKHRTRIGPIFGPVINWASGFNFEVQYKTVIQQYRDGIEERESIRVDPRLRIEFTGHFMDTDAEDFVAEFSRNYDSIWYFPLPFRSAMGEQVIAEGAVDATRLTFGTAGLPFWAVAGASLVLQSNGARELATVASASLEDAEVTFTAPVVSPFVGELQVFSAIPVQFEADTTMKLLTTNLYEFRAGIYSVVGEEVFPIKPYTPDATLNSQAVYTKRPNWREGVDHILDPIIRRSDFGFGRRYVRMMNDFVSSTRKMSFLYGSASEFEAYLSFMHYLKGRRRPFWYPEWGDLLERQAGSSPSNNRLYTANKYLGRNYSGSKTHRNVFLRFMNGQWAARQITEFNVVANPNYVGFSAAPQTLTDASLDESTWLTLNRFAADEFVFQFSSSVAGEVEVSMKNLPTREVQ